MQSDKVTHTLRSYSILTANASEATDRLKLEFNLHSNQAQS